MTTPVAPTETIEQELEAALEAAGAKAIVMWAVAEVPWLGGWFVNPFLGFFAGIAAKFIISELDKIGFAVYTAAKVGVELSNFLTAEEIGNQQQIDSSGATLINLGSP